MSDDEDEPKMDRISNIIDLSAARPSHTQGWMARLHKNKDGGPYPTVANAIIFLNNDPVLADLTLSFDAFRTEHLLHTAPPIAEETHQPLAGPYPRQWMQADIILIQSYLQRIWCPRFSRNTVEDAMLAVASSHRFHPVCDWLDTLRWDNFPRLDLWMTNVFDCDNTPYHRAVASKFLIAAIRRVRQPGCKFDHMPVLEGAQGIGKSTAIRELFGPAWCSDSIPSDLGSRDAALGLDGLWCLEFAEIEHLIRNEVETIKSYLSRCVDRIREPYGRKFVWRPRQSVFIGTTNSDDYLRDASGNRRIWPIKCRRVSQDYIRVNRDQLWAEASIREAANEPIWLIEEDLSVAATTAQVARMSQDIWTDKIIEYLSVRKECKIDNILSDAVNMPLERQNKSAQMRVANVLKFLGWQRAVAWKGKTARIWLAPGYDSSEQDQTSWS